MLRVVGSLAALLLSMGVMLLGNGLFSTLATLRMTIESFSPAVIGLIVACHSFGFGVACLTCDQVIRKVGHIRVFAAFAATLAICAMLFPVVVDPLAWMVLRLLFGYAAAAVFMVGESWLAGAAPADMKGKVFAIYMVVNKGCFGTGQLLLILGEPAGDRLFMLTASLYALCLIPIALAPTAGPKGLEAEPLGLRELYRLSPVGVAGAIAAGAVNASLIGLGPVFASQSGLTVTQVSVFMATFLAGSLLLQIPIGRCSDRFDRRTVLLVVAFFTAAACLVMASAAASGFTVLVGLSALVGGLSATVYPIAVTHANDLARPEQTVSLHAGLLLSFAVGASIGPVIASLGIQAIGPAGLFAYGAIVSLLLALFTVYRMTRRTPAPNEMQTGFVAMPQTSQTTPAVSRLVPRADDAD